MTTAFLTLAGWGGLLALAPAMWLVQGSRGRALLVWGMVGGGGWFALQGMMLATGLTDPWQWLFFRMDTLSGVMSILVGGAGAVLAGVAGWSDISPRRQEKLAVFAAMMWGVQGTLLSATPGISVLLWGAVIAGIAAGFFLQTPPLAGTTLPRAPFLLFALLFSMMVGFSAVSPLARAALLFGLVCIAGVLPFQGWLHAQHALLPPWVSAYCSLAVVPVAITTIVRVVSIPAAPLFPLGTALFVLGMISAVLSVLTCAVERDIPKSLSYLRTQHVGVFLVVIGSAALLTANGFAEEGRTFLRLALLATVIFGLWHGAITLALGDLVARTGIRNGELLGGIARRAPTLTGVLGLAAWSGSGLPPFGAFLPLWIVMFRYVTIIQVHDEGKSGMIAVAGMLFFAFLSGIGVLTMMKTFGAMLLGNVRSPEAARITDGSTLFVGAAAIFAGTTVVVSCLAPLWGIWGNEFPGSSGMFPLVMAAVLGGVTLLGMVVLQQHRSARIVPIWASGVPATSRMALGIIAFSSSVRLFFRFALWTKKTVTDIPLVSVNPWITTRVVRWDSAMWERVTEASVVGIRRMRALLAHEMSASTIRRDLLLFSLFFLGVLVFAL